MRLPSRTTGAIVAVLLGTVAVGVAWQFYRDRVPEIADAGGTILEYQLDPHVAQAMGGHADPAALAEALRRRFAYCGLRHVQTRPAGPDRVEVLIPHVGDHGGDVRAVKALVARVGRLEFRVLANSDDDHEAIAAAQSLANDVFLADANVRREFVEAQRNGAPPPGPRHGDGTPWKFTIGLARGQTSTVTYHWVELGEPERRALNLDNAARNDPGRDATWKEALAQRGRAVPLPARFGPPGGPVPFVMQGALFYSRDCRDRNLTDGERAYKAVEYFVLARDPEFDPATGQQTPAIDGSFLVSATAARDPGLGARIDFNLNAAGAERFAALTRANVPTPGGPDGPGLRRHLAILVDGLVMTAPTISSEIHDRASIMGSFTDREIADLVGILRAGALPAPLLPRPVRETVVAPGGAP